jgi:ABC-type antimicrobial peptide transport system permease subunit
MALLTSLKMYQEYLRDHIRDYKEHSDIYEQYLKEYYNIGKTNMDRDVITIKKNIKTNIQEVMKANKELDIITDKINYINKINNNQNYLKEIDENLKLLRMTVEVQQKHIIVISVISIISFVINIFQFL